ncbi:hypothetical protein FRC09_004416 [Ceratobasidium sp. 395]|nr:hypothetical protein FRC09_004416 [Ceratobasidium sp. 395]
MEQLSFFETNLSSPSDLFHFNSTLSCSRSSHDSNTFSFSGLPLSPVASNTSDDINRFLCASRGFNAAPQSQLDANHAHLAHGPTQGQTRQRIATNAGAVTSFDALDSPHAGASTCLSEPRSRARTSQLCADSVGSSLLDDRRKRVVESEQRRRNDLRGGFARLKEALPVSRDKCSKLDLLDRATMYIGHLEAKLRDKREEVSAVEVNCLAR